MTSILGQSFDYNTTSNKGNAYYDDLKLGTTNSEDLQLITDNKVRLTVDDDTGDVVVVGNLSVNGTTAISGDLDAKNLPNLETIGTLDNTITALGNLDVNQTFYAPQIDADVLDITGDATFSTNLIFDGATSTNKVVFPLVQNNALSIGDTNGGFMYFNSNTNKTIFDRDVDMNCNTTFNPSYQTTINGDLTVDVGSTTTIKGSVINTDSWGHVSTLDQELTTFADVDFNRIDVNQFHMNTVIKPCDTTRITLELDKVNLITAGLLNDALTILEIPALPLKPATITYVHIQVANDVVLHISAVSGVSLFQIYNNNVNNSSDAVLDDANPYRCKGNNGVAYMITTYSGGGVSIVELNEPKEISTHELDFTNGTLNKIRFPVSLPTALVLGDVNDDYMVFNTTDNRIEVKQDLNLDTIEFTGATGANELVVPDSLAESLVVRDGTNDYMVFNTTDNKIEVKQDINMPYTQYIPELFTWDNTAGGNFTFPDTDTVIKSGGTYGQCYTTETFDVADSRTFIFRVNSIDTGGDSHFVWGVVNSDWSNDTGFHLEPFSMGTINNDGTNYMFVAGEQFNTLAGYYEVLNDSITIQQTNPDFNIVAGDVCRVEYSNTTMKFYVNSTLFLNTTRPNAYGTLKFIVAQPRNGGIDWDLTILTSIATIPANKLASLTIRDDTDDYMVFNTTDNKIEVKQDLNLDTIEFTGATGANEIVFPDSLAESLVIRDGTNDYMIFDTTDNRIEVKQDLEASGMSSLYSVNVGNIYKFDKTITGTNLTVSDFEINRTTTTALYYQLLKPSFPKNSRTSIEFTYIGGGGSTLWIGIGGGLINQGAGAELNSPTDLGYYAGYRLYRDFDPTIGFSSTTTTEINLGAYSFGTVRFEWDYGTLTMYQDGVFKNSYTPSGTEYDSVGNISFFIGDQNPGPSSFHYTISTPTPISFLDGGDISFNDQLRIKDSTQDYLIFNTEDKTVNLSDLSVNGFFKFFQTLGANLALTITDYNITRLGTNTAYTQTLQGSFTKTSTAEITIRRNSGTGTRLWFGIGASAELGGGDNLQFTDITEYYAVFSIIEGNAMTGSDAEASLTHTEINEGDVVKLTWVSGTLSLYINGVFDISFTPSGATYLASTAPLRWVIGDTNQFVFSDFNIDILQVDPTSFTLTGLHNTLTIKDSTQDYMTFNTQDSKVEMKQDVLIDPTKTLLTRSIDTDASAPLDIGDLTASAVNIGAVGIDTTIQGNLFIDGNLNHGVIIKDNLGATPYVVADGISVVLVGATTAAVDIQLPLISSLSTARMITVKHRFITFTNPVRVIRSGSDLIDGATTITYSTAYESFTFIPSLTLNQWFII